MTTTISNLATTYLTSVTLRTRSGAKATIKIVAIDNKLYSFLHDDGIKSVKQIQRRKCTKWKASVNFLTYKIQSY